MQDEARTKKDLIAELVTLRQRFADLERKTPRGKAGESSSKKEGRGDSQYLVDHISDGVFKTDRNGNFTFVNRGMVNRSGMAPDKFYALNFLDIIASEDQERLRGNFEKVLRGEAVAPYELSYQKADGGVVTVEINMSAIYEEGEVVGVQGISRDLTERKHMEKVIKKNEERFKKMVQNGRDAISLVSPEGIFLFISDAVEHIIGYPPEELVGRHWGDFVHPDDLHMVAEKQAFLIKKAGNIETAEVRGRHRDGSWRWIEMIGSNQVDDPEIGAFIVNFRDITDRKLAEEAATESEHRFKQLFENMSSCMAVYEVGGAGEDFVLKDFNKSAEKADQINREDIIGKSVLDVFPGVKDMGLFEVFQRVWRTGKPEQYPAKRYKDGRIEGWRENYVYRLPSGEIVAIYDDRTEQKRTEMVAKENEERFRSLFDRSLECIYLLDFKGRLLDANPAALDLLGYDREGIPSIDLASLLTPEQVPKAFRQLEEIKTFGFQKEIMELRIRRKDGTFLDFETNTSLVYRDGAPYAIMGIARDITERKQHVDRLRRAMGATVQAMAVVVETRDPYTAGHQRRVADLARSIASEIGLSKQQVDGIRTAAAIHDIGKISVPAEILSKPTRLSDMEFSLIQLHPQAGYDILKDIEFPWPVARMILEHHERVDGSGYPYGLRGDDVLLESRIVAVADVVEAIASHRPYRPGLGIGLALEEITNNRGTKFDPEAVDACLRLFNEKGYTLVGE